MNLFNNTFIIAALEKFNFSRKEQYKLNDVNNSKPSVIIEILKRFRRLSGSELELSKFSEMLGSRENTIESTRQLIEHTLQLKKDLMRKWLGEENFFETSRLHNDKKSNKDDFKTWRKVQLKDVVEVMVSNVEFNDNDQVPVRVCTCMDVVTENYLTKFSDLSKATINTKEILSLALRKDDIIILIESSVADDVAAATLVVGDMEEAICAKRLAIIRSKYEFINGPYLYYYLNFLKSQCYFTICSTEGSPYKLSLDVIKETYFYVPDLNRQKEIAKDLMDIDDVIDVQERQIVELERQQKHIVKVIPPILEV